MGHFEPSDGGFQRPRHFPECAFIRNNLTDGSGAQRQNGRLITICYLFGPFMRDNLRYMALGALLQSAWVRTIVAVFFFLSGAFVTLLLTLGTPSFWYFPCGILWALSGFVWLVRPSFAAGLSAFPVLGITVMVVQTLPNYQQTDSSFQLLMLCVVIALALITTTFRQRETRKVMATAISFSLVLTAFAVDRLFTNKVEVHSYSMSWSANGIAPWGRVETDEKGEPPVVIYRMVNQGYCYDAIFSPELKARLTASSNDLPPEN